MGMSTYMSNERRWILGTCISHVPSEGGRIVECLVRGGGAGVVWAMVEGAGGE